MSAINPIFGILDGIDFITVEIRFKVRDRLSLVNKRVRIVDGSPLEQPFYSEERRDNPLWFAGCFFSLIHSWRSWDRLLAMGGFLGPFTGIYYS